MFQRGAKLLQLLLVLTTAVYGHAILISAAPAAKQSVAGPEIPVELKFNSRIDAQRSRITIVAPDGKQTTLAIEEQKSPDTLAARAHGLKTGSYILRWQVLAKDGHITRGELPFQVQ